MGVTLLPFVLNTDCSLYKGYVQFYFMHAFAQSMWDLAVHTVLQNMSTVRGKNQHPDQQLEYAAQCHHYFTHYGRIPGNLHMPSCLVCTLAVACCSKA